MTKPLLNLEVSFSSSKKRLFLDDYQSIASSILYDQQTRSFSQGKPSKCLKNRKKQSFLPPSLIQEPSEKEKLNFNLFDGCNIFKDEDDQSEQSDSEDNVNPFIKKKAVCLDNDEEKKQGKEDELSDEEEECIKKCSADTNDTSVTYFNFPSLIPEDKNEIFPSEEVEEYKKEDDEIVDVDNDKINLIYPLIDSDEEHNEPKISIKDKDNKKKDEVILKKELFSFNEDEFSNNSNQTHLLSNLLVLAKEQTSCRYLQQAIDKNPKLGTVYLYPVIIKNITELITNQFGNYLIQKLFGYISQNQFSDILNAIVPDFVLISTNFYGTRVLQRMIDCINSQYQMLSFLKIISNHISDLLNDINASHIINKLLSLRQFYITSSIYEMINQNFLTIALHKHGCCSIQKILENDLIFTEGIISNILTNAITLITHQYGNYIIQFLIQTKHQLISFRLIVILLPHFSKLAKMKYSSTVLEKCFEYCNEQSKSFLYNVLYNKGVVKSLIFDKFGNYVVQKAIDSAKDEKIRFYLLRLIAPMINDVKKENFGKQMCMKLCSKYPQFQEYIKNFKKGK